MLNNTTFYFVSSGIKCPLHKNDEILSFTVAGGSSLAVTFCRIIIRYAWLKCYRVDCITNPERKNTNFSHDRANGFQITL